MSPSERAALQSEVQAAARETLAEIVAHVEPTSTERSLCDVAVRLLADRGLTETWYYDCPALVLAGERSCRSESGRTYVPDDARPIGDTNLVTIDLSPCRDGVWGDCARSIYVEGGVATDSPSKPEFVEGHAFVLELHERMREFVTPQTTFHELCIFAADAVDDAGFENLDFLGNFGHSIVSRLDDRTYIAPGESRRLADVGSFTFEPHLRRRGGRWGFKREDVYRFASDGSLELV